MAYYSGQASSYQELQNVLVASCIAHGWSLSNGVLTKDNVFLGLVANEDGTSKGIVATGYTSADKQNPSTTRPRLGAPSSTINHAVFPVDYSIFIFENEVYLIAKFNIDFYFYLAFGISHTDPLIPRLWITASAATQSVSSDSRGAFGFDSNGSVNGNTSSSSPIPFAKYGYSNSLGYNSVIQSGVDDVVWSSSSKNATTTKFLMPLYSRSPSSWSSETIFLPINVFIDRPSNKVSLICQFENARFIRVNNYNPEQIVVMGNDKWMILPFYKKNSEVTAAWSSDDSGTFGWAIRYDGP